MGCYSDCTVPGKPDNNNQTLQYQFSMSVSLKRPGRNFWQTDEKWAWRSELWDWAVISYARVKYLIGHSE